MNLDQFQGLAQQGEVGLQDKVNHHYISIFGAAIAVAAIGGVSNIGNATTGVTYKDVEKDSDSQTPMCANVVGLQAANRLFCFRIHGLTSL